MWNMPLFPIFNRKILSFLLRNFRETFFKIWEGGISIGNHIDDRKDNFIGFSTSKKLFIYLGSAANIGFLNSFLLEINIKLIDRVDYCKSWKCEISSCENDIFSTW